MRASFAALLAALLFLAGCAATPGQSSTDATPTAAPPVATPAPTAAPAPTADPSQGIAYTQMPLLSEKSGGTVYLSLPDAQEAAVRQFVEGLYTNDADAVRAACSDTVTGRDFPLADLTALNVTEYMLSGGTYDYPAVSLTVENAGNTPLLRGCHEYRFAFDENDKISSFSLWMPGDTSHLDLRKTPLNLQEWAVVETCDSSSAEADGTNRLSGTVILGHKADSLGLTLDEVCAYRFSAHGDSADDAVFPDTFDFLRDCPLPLTGGGRIYGTPPQGNVADKTDLQDICRDLNTAYRTLAEGCYAESYGTDLTNAGRLAGWDAAYPLPVSVTPENIRTEYQFPNGDPDQPWLYIWVPLPQGRWVVYGLADTDYNRVSRSYCDLYRTYCTAEPLL